MRWWVVPSTRVLAVALATLALAACTSSSTSGDGQVSTVPGTSAVVSAPVAAPSSPSLSSRRPTPSVSRSTKPRTTPTQTPTHTSASVHQPNGALTVVLNPGHNGGNATHSAAINRQVPAGYGTYKACATTGTTTNAGYPEHAFNWDVSLRVRTILRAHGIRVVLTRPSDTG